MGLFVDIEVFGEKHVSREIMLTGIRARQLNPVFAAIFRRMEEIHDEHMRSHGARGGTPWEALKPETILAKARAGSSTPEEPEFRFHKLYEALTSPSSPDHEEFYNDEWAVWRVTGDPGVYGPIQQKGSDKINLPARPLSVFTLIDRESFVKEIQLWIRRGTLTHFL